MADAVLKFEYRISQGDGLLFAIGSAFAAVLALGAVASTPPTRGHWGWVLDFGFALLYAARAVLMARWSLRALWTGPRKPTCVELTEDILKVPSLFSVGRITETLVPLEHVTKMADSRTGSLESLSVWHAEQGASIVNRFFASQEDFEAMRVALTERAEIQGVPIKRRDNRFDRLQFSLRFLLLLTTVVAAVLGFLAYANILHWQLVAMAVVWGFAFIVVFLAFRGPRWMRVFCAGASFGICAAAVALIVIGQSGLIPALFMGEIQPVYPFSLLLSGSPADASTRIVWAGLNGTLFSGLLFGGLAIAVRAVTKRLGRKHRAS